MSKTSAKINAKVKHFWGAHKVWSLVLGFLFVVSVVLPVIGVLVDFLKDGSDPVEGLKTEAMVLVQIIGSGIIAVIVLVLLSLNWGRWGGGSPSGTTLSNLENRSSVHPQSDYRAQDRAAQEARDAAAQGRDALNALERAGGDPTTMQKLKWEIDRADRDAKNFQEWAED